MMNNNTQNRNNSYYSNRCYNNLSIMGTTILIQTILLLVSLLILTLHVVHGHVGGNTAFVFGRPKQAKYLTPPPTTTTTTRPWFTKTFERRIPTVPPLSIPVRQTQTNLLSTTRSSSTIISSESTTRLSINNDDNRREDVVDGSSSSSSYTVGGSEQQYDDYDEEEDKCNEEEEFTYQINLQIADLMQSASRDNTTAADVALELLRTQLQQQQQTTSSSLADTVTYNTILKAYAKTSSPNNLRAGKISYELLQEMEELHKQQTQSSLLWFQRNRNNNLTSEEFSIGPPRVKVKPNVRTYSICMDCFARQCSVYGANMSEILLQQLQTKYYNNDTDDGEQQQDYAYLPNSISYNTVISAWSKSGTKLDGATKCEKYLYDMIELGIADVISFNAACHAWARSGQPDAGKYAERLLDEMSEYVKPNARTYSIVIDAWSRSFGRDDSAERAHALLIEMENLADEGDTSMRPNYVTYSTAINAYALSQSEPFKAHKAFALLQRMIQQSTKNKDPTIRPNCVTYNTVLNAIATSNPNAMFNTEDNSLQSDLPTLPEMVRTLYSQILESNLRPDHYTFGTVLKAIANLFWSEPDQGEFSKEVFQEACKRGYVTFGVLSQFKQAAPADVYRSLIPENAYNRENRNIVMKHIPKEWRRNAREQKKHVQ